MADNILKIYTDGACANNQGEENFGGWGAVLEFNGNIKELHGGEANTTNNRMELTAVIEAFKALKREGLKVEIYSDSSYVMNCFREKWYINWRKNGWKNSKKEPVENRELWEELLALTEVNDCTFYRVKGHVNLDSPNTDVKGHFKKFKEWNGNHFKMADFKKVTEMNNRCDERANIGIDEIRPKE